MKARKGGAGVETGGTAVPEKGTAKAQRTASATKKNVEKKVGAAAGGKRPTAKKAAGGPIRAVNKKSPFNIVVGVIRRRRVKGIGVAEIREKTGLSETQIRNAVYRARARGLIVSQSRGLYVKGPNSHIKHEAVQ